MTEQESKQFFKIAFAAFPGLPQWAKENSSDFGMTLVSWARTLSNTTLEEATEIIDGWIDGTIADPPVGYKRETFALQVKAIAAQRKFERTKHLREEEEWMKTNRKNYIRPVGLVLISPYLQRIFREQDRFRAGEISQSDLADATDAIIEEFANAKA
jgi:hypothetical protein